MRALSTICLLGVLVAAFSTVAALALGEALESTGNRAAPAAASRSASVSPGAPEQLLELMRELLDGREAACDRIVPLLLGLGEGAEADAEIDRDHIAKVFGIETGETVDCRWMFRTLLGLGDGEEINNPEFVRLLLGIDDHEDLDTEAARKIQRCFRRSSVRDWALCNPDL